MSVQIYQIDGGRKTFTMKEVRLDDHAIASCIGQNDPNAAVQQLASARHREVNAKTLTNAETELRNLESQKKDEEDVRSKHQLERKKTAAQLYTKTPAKHDKMWRLSTAERINQFFYGIVRFILLGITVGVIALYARASGFSAELSTSWMIAFAFAFPAFAASAVIANRIDTVDDLEEKRRITNKLRAIAIVFLFIWIGATAITFAPKSASSSSAFTVNFSSTQQSVDSVQVLINWLFPQSLIGIVLLLMHVLTDVFAAAALAAHSKLQGLKGRESLPNETKATVLQRELVDFHSGRLKILDKGIKECKSAITAFEANKVAAVEFALARLNILNKRVKAQQTIAEVDAIEAIMKAAR